MTFALLMQAGWLAGACKLVGWLEHTSWLAGWKMPASWLAKATCEFTMSVVMCGCGRPTPAPIAVAPPRPP